MHLRINQCFGMSTLLSALKKEKTLQPSTACEWLHSPEQWGVRDGTVVLVLTFWGFIFYKTLMLCIQKLLSIWGDVKKPLCLYPH